MVALNAEEKIVFAEKNRQFRLSVAKSATVSLKGSCNA